MSMNWYSGAIPEAVARAKSCKGILFVFISDKSETSKDAEKVFEDSEIGNLFSDSKFISIHLQNGTPEAQQFSQIYPVVLVPSMFFISGDTGIPLEVIGGPITGEKLKERMNNLAESSSQSTEKTTPDSTEVSSHEVESKSHTNSSDNSFVNQHPSEGSNAGGGSKEPLKGATTTTPPSVVPTSSSGAIPKSVKDSSLKSESTSTVNTATAENCKTTDSVAPLTLSAAELLQQEEEKKALLQQKVDRAKVLLAQKQEEKAAKEKGEAKQKELERRSQGTQIAQERQKREQERIELAKERKKDKENDRLARERVKAQIAADRAEREAGAALLRGEEPPKPSAPPADAAHAGAQQNASGNARIKFRLPDGSTLLDVFESDARLSTLRTYLQDTGALSSTDFQLSSILLQKPYTEEQMQMTLRELELCPASIVVVTQTLSSFSSRLRPSSGSVSRGVVPSQNGLMKLIWILLSPLTFLYSTITQFLGFGGSTSSSYSPNGNEPTSEDRSSTADNSLHGPSSSPAPKRRRAEQNSNMGGASGRARFRLVGNIHRLTNEDDDDDDDNNTWNGNSTQQM